MVTTALFKPRLFFSHATHLHTKPTEFDLFCLFICSRKQCGEHSLSRLFVFLLSRESTGCLKKKEIDEFGITWIDISGDSNILERLANENLEF